FVVSGELVGQRPQVPGSGPQRRADGEGRDRRGPEVPERLPGGVLARHGRGEVLADVLERLGRGLVLAGGVGGLGLGGRGQRGRGFEQRLQARRQRVCQWLGIAPLLDQGAADQGEETGARQVLRREVPGERGQRGVGVGARGAAGGVEEGLGGGLQV